MSGAINPFMFIFTCRPGSHPFLEVINEYDGKTEIALQSLTRNSVRQFVAEMLMLDDVEDCTELANFISRVTNGNPFFIQQQLVSLRDEGLIRFGNHGYVWNIDEIEQIHGDLSGDVVVMLSEKMKRLPSVTQQALKICACIGSTVDADILGLLIRETLTVEGSESQDNEALAKMAIAPASQEGLLAEIEGGRRLTFTHDSVNEAAHLLLEPDLEANFHLTLGLILQKNVCPNLFRKYLFTIAAQLSRGIKLIVTKEDRVAAAEIFLNAGEKSKAASAFPEAHFFFKKGYGVLREEDWATDYRLFCDLYMKAADTAALTGDFKHMEECLAIVFSHCEGSLVDFLNASFIKARAMASRDDPEALDVGLEALRLAGEKFPTRNHAVHSLLGLVRTRRLMKAKGATALFQLPPIADRQMAATRRLLSLVQNIAPTVDQRLIPLLIFRSIQLNLKHGYSTTTPHSVASYAFLLSRLGFPLTEAVKYGEIALKLQEKHNQNEVIPAVTYATYGLLFPLVKSLSDCVKPLRAGYDAGAKSGDTAQAMSCATVMTWMLFFSGMRLSKVSHYLDKYRQSMSEHNMTRSLHQNRIYRNVVDFCLGASNASKFFFEDGDGATTSTESTKTNLILQQQSKFTQLVVACLFSDSGMAWAMSEKLDEFRSLYAGTIWPYICSFYRGMAATAMSSSSRQSTGTAKSCLKHLRKGRKKGVANLSHQLFLLEAEYAASRKKYASAEKFYSRSIEHAAQAGVTHEHALACEKFGSYHIMRKNHNAAYEQIREAHRLYLKWGARPKCEQLKKKYPRLEG